MSQFHHTLRPCLLIGLRLTLCQIGKTSAFIGPFVSSAIITASGNNDNYPFVFLFSLCVNTLAFLCGRLTEYAWASSRGVASTVFLYLVDVKKSHAECEAFIAAEAERKAFAVPVV